MTFTSTWWTSQWAPSISASWCVQRARRPSAANGRSVSSSSSTVTRRGPILRAVYPGRRRGSRLRGRTAAPVAAGADDLQADVEVVIRGRIGETGTLRLLWTGLALAQLTELLADHPHDVRVVA